MKKFVVFADSTSDIEKKYRLALDFDYLKMGYNIDGKDYEADLDWANMSPTDYYNKMRQGSRARTNQVLTAEIENKFEEALKHGYDVLYVACSSKLSTSCNYAKTLAEDILAKYPERKVICVDSLRSNYAQGAMAMYCAQMALDGKTVDEAAAYCEENKLYYQTFATVGSLSYLAQAGRVKASKAFFGNLFGVKPIIVGDVKGNNYGFDKAKGRKNSLDRLVELCKERLLNNETATVYVEHADCEKDAQYVANAIKAATGCREVNVSAMGPIIGTSCGPDTITVNFYGKKMDIVGEE